MYSSLTRTDVTCQIIAKALNIYNCNSVYLQDNPKGNYWHKIKNDMLKAIYK